MAVFDAALTLVALYCSCERAFQLSQKQDCATNNREDCLAYTSCRPAPGPQSGQLQVGGPLQHDPWHFDGHHRLVDRFDLASGHLPGYRPNPLVSSNASYLLWLLMGYMVVTAVLVVSFGRIGDMFGRVKVYNLGFAIFSAARSPPRSPTSGTIGRPLPDRHAHRPRRGRSDDHGQLDRHHY